MVNIMLDGHSAPDVAVCVREVELGDVLVEVGVGEVGDRERARRHRDAVRHLGARRQAPLQVVA